MSKVRQSNIKKIAHQIYNRYPDEVSSDFHLNKLLLEEVMEGGNKRFRNRIAGYLVNLKNKEGRVILAPYRGIKDIRKRRRELRKKR